MNTTRGVLVVIVNYRTSAMAIDCLRSLADEMQVGRPVRVIVIDNDSHDGSADSIALAVESEGFGAWAQVKPQPRNGGFAWGNNAAIGPALASDAPPDYVLLLNSDTIVRSNAIAALVNFMDDHPEVGIAGSRLEDPDGTPQRSAFRFPSILSEFENGIRLGPVSRLLTRWAVAPPAPKSACRTDWVAGASMIVRRDVFDHIGLLDDQYFMYYEEVDFCRRAAKMGASCWYVPQSRVVHLVGRASGITDVTKPLNRWPRYWFESRSHYFRTHHGRAMKLLIDLVWIAGRCLYKIVNVVRRKPNNDPPKLLSDFVMNNLFPGSSGT